MHIYNIYMEEEFIKIFHSLFCFTFKNYTGESQSFKFKTPWKLLAMTIGERGKKVKKKVT